MIEDAVRKFGEAVVAEAQSELSASGKSSSGALFQSATFELYRDKNRIEVEFGHGGLYYATFVHEGVSGTEVTRDTPYAFTTKQPPSDVIEGWMRAVNMNVEERRFGSVAFLIARSIKRRGLEGVKHFDRAVETLLPKYEKLFVQSALEEVSIRINL